MIDSRPWLRLALAGVLGGSLVAACGGGPSVRDRHDRLGCRWRGGLRDREQQRQRQQWGEHQQQRRRYRRILGCGVGAGETRACLRPKPAEATVADAEVPDAMSAGQDATVDASGEDATVDASPGDATVGTLPEAATGDANVDAAPEAGPVCSSGTTQCVGNGVEACSGGQWGTPMDCGNQACVSGGCSGVCAPNSTQCSGNGVQTCNASGNWGTSVVCTSQACVVTSGTASCQGACTPGAPQCDGASLQTCDATGNWGADQACPSGACTGTQCSGICVAGATQCSGNGLQTCTAGQWGSPVDCGNQACVGTGAGALCQGVCAPNATSCATDADGGSTSTVQTCSATGTWTPTSACPFACVNGPASGVCAPGTTSCSGNGVQTCETNGQWGSAVCVLEPGVRRTGRAWARARPRRPPARTTASRPATTPGRSEPPAPCANSACVGGALRRAMRTGLDPVLGPGRADLRQQRQLGHRGRMRRAPRASPPTARRRARARAPREPRSAPAAPPSRRAIDGQPGSAGQLHQSGVRHQWQLGRVPGRVRPGRDRVRDRRERHLAQRRIDVHGAAGTWGPPSTCSNMTCLVTGVTASCGGVCAPGQTQCSGNSALQTCTASGHVGDRGVLHEPGVRRTRGHGFVPGGVLARGDRVRDRERTAARSTACRRAAPPVPGARPSTCSNQACVGGSCTGSCAPGATLCNGNGVETCSATGAYGSPVACGNSACSGGVCTGTCTPGASQCFGQRGGADLRRHRHAAERPSTARVRRASASGTTASCQGVCTPGATECTNNGVSTCSASGAWGTPQTCTNKTCLVSREHRFVPGRLRSRAVGVLEHRGAAVVQRHGDVGDARVTASNQTCVGTGVGSSCQGVCAPGQTECSSTSAQQSCGPHGDLGDPVNCTNQTCVGTGVGSSCQGVCAPGQLQCSGSQPQNCSAAGDVAEQRRVLRRPGVLHRGVHGRRLHAATPWPSATARTACDVRSNTCCVTVSLNPTGRCVSGTTATCNSNEAPFHCRYSCDCPAGQSCCGAIDTQTLSGTATCQAVANGGSCSVPAGFTAAAQLCEQDEECKNGQPCIAQTCVFDAMFKFCGLQSQPPYKCTAN